MAFNVLVVDDSDVIRSMIARTLRLAQVPVGELFEASNGREALAVLGEEWVDLVLADINMPIMDGAEMLEEMLRRPETADVPVIVVSSEGANDRVSLLMERGVTAWIRKPFTPEEIRDVISEVTGTWPPAEERQAHVDAVFGPVLETFAFVFPEPVNAESAPEAQGEIMCATITFSGATSGTMSLAAPADLCAELAGNILGLEPGDPEALRKGADTLGEIANIAAGHLATRLEPDHQTDLHPPVVSRLERADWDVRLAQSAARIYSVEDHPVIVMLGLRPLVAVC